MRNEVPVRETNFAYKALQRFAFAPLVPDITPQEKIERDTGILKGNTRQ